MCIVQFIWDHSLARYEGTGRSLSLKLLEQLRQQSVPGAKPAGDAALVGRTLHECELKESIRFVYSTGLLFIGCKGFTVKLTITTPGIEVATCVRVG